MKDEVYDNPVATWRGLCAIGSLELDGRDEGTEEKLRQKLDPAAPTLDAILEKTTNEQFLKAFFSIIQPWSMMFQDVLDLFKAAGAKQGQHRFRIAIVEGVFGLEHFEEFLKTWNEIDIDMEVPAVDSSGAFIINDVRNHLMDRLANNELSYDFSPDVERWLKAYDEGEYLALPESLTRDLVGPGLADTLNIVMVALAVIKKAGHNRDSLYRDHVGRRFYCYREDGLHLWTIAQNETDFWLRTCVKTLAQVSKLEKDDQAIFDTLLQDKYLNFPRRRIAGKVRAEDLQKLLSLPVWKKRQEFYGVWIATRVMHALDEHKVEIHHSEGELQFAFREAVIADVETAVPPISLYSERRTKLENPIGKGRKGNVQPDFGLWSEGEEPENCAMVIEVKHYKRRCKTNFINALIDYANAHPQAKTLLVNYGPVGQPFTDMPRELESRCEMLGDLTPENTPQIKKFNRLVRKVVGDPLVRITDVDWICASTPLVLDISASMSGILRSDWFTAFLTQISDVDCEIILVDESIRGRLKASDVKSWLSYNNLGSITSLSCGVNKILDDSKRLVLISDSDGLANLNVGSASTRTIEMPNSLDVRLLEISMADSQLETT